ncbi:MAG: hypothetical protein OXT09_19555 [Myxococcales bacterium]|nr:hypothetical protein [Myxococcales bacterium]
MSTTSSFVSCGLRSATRTSDSVVQVGSAVAASKVASGVPS